MKYSHFKMTSSSYVRLVALLMLTCLLSACIGNPTALLAPDTNIAKDLDADGKVGEVDDILQKTPRGKGVYIFFISTSEAYSKEGVDDVVKAMQVHFKAFGRDIGKNNFAIWVNEKGTHRLSARHGKFIADRYHLQASSRFDYSKGPYLIVTNIHPIDAFDEKFEHVKIQSDTLANPFVAGVSLNNVSSKYIIDVLNSIEQGIRRNKLTQAELVKVEAWLTLETWFDSNKEAVSKILNEVFITVLGTRKK